MRVKWWLLAVICTVAICLTVTSMPSAVEHPWDVDNRPGCGSPIIIVGAQRPSDTLTTNNGNRGGAGSSGAATRTPVQVHTRTWFEAAQRWFATTFARFSGSIGDGE